MFNKVILIGNLTRNLELRYSPSGLAIGKTGIATNRSFKTQNGENKDEVMFIDLTFFGRTAEIANQYLKKGSKVLAEGRLILEQWTDQSGQKRSRHSVTVETMKMLDGKGDNHGISAGFENAEESYDGYNMSASLGRTSSSGYQQPPQRAVAQAPAHRIPEINIDEDEIPF